MTFEQSPLSTGMAAWVARKRQSGEATTSQTDDALRAVASGVQALLRDLSVDEEVQSRAPRVIRDNDCWRLPALQRFGAQMRDLECAERREGV